MRATRLLTSYIDRSIRTKVDRAVGKDPRADPHYSALYRQAGCPRTWPYPLPIFVGSEGLHRYAYSHVSTERKVISLPAGQSALLLTSFWDTKYLLQNWVSGLSGRILASATWDRNQSAVDQNYYNGLSVDFYGNEAMVKTGREYLEDANTAKVTPTPNPNVPGYFSYKPESANSLPLMSQLIGGNLHVEIACPYDGQFSVATISEGEQHAHIGQKHQLHQFDANPNAPYQAAIPDGLAGKYRAVYGVFSAMSPIDAAFKIGTVHLCTGATKSANFKATVPLVNEKGWSYSGVLDETDAPPTGTVSMTQNMRPRNNIQYQMQFGCVAIRNTGAVPITLISSTDVVQAHVLDADDGLRSVSSLVSELRQQAQSLKLNSGGDAHTSVLPKTMTGSSGTVTQKIQEHMTGSGVPTDLTYHATATDISAPKEPVITVEKHTETDSLTAGRVIAAIPNLVGQVVSAYSPFRASGVTDPTPTDSHSAVVPTDSFVSARSSAVTASRAAAAAAGGGGFMANASKQVAELVTLGKSLEGFMAMFL